LSRKGKGTAGPGVHLDPHCYKGWTKEKRKKEKKKSEDEGRDTLPTYIYI
jgi:hypothetical protein